MATAAHAVIRIMLATLRTMIKRLFLAVVLAATTGCQAMVYGTASGFDKLQVGMTKDQVIDAVGEPVATEADGDRHEEYLIYKKMKHAVSEWPRTYKVTLRDGHVVKWGEQYKESNVNVY